MYVKDIMARNVKLTSPDENLVMAAKTMEETDAGVLPVGDRDRLVGMITDRDIAIRAVARGRDPHQTRVRDVMTSEVKYCFEDEELDHVAENMAEQQLHRLSVMDRDKRLVGILSIGNIASAHDASRAGHALSGIVRPSELHNQSHAATR